MAESKALVPQAHGGAIHQGRPEGFSNPNTGRKPNLTPEIHKQIISDIKNGNYAQIAAQRAGITEQTFYNWLKNGENGQDPYRKFFEAVLIASSEAEKNKLDTIDTAAKSDWKAAGWWLERRFPKRWGKQERLEITTSPDLSDDAW